MDIPLGLRIEIKNVLKQKKKEIQNDIEYLNSTVFIKCRNGKMIPVYIDEKDTMKNLKEKI